MTEQVKKQLQDKFWESDLVNDNGSFAFFKDPIKVSGTVTGMENNMTLLESFIKHDGDYYYDVDNHISNQSISVMIYDVDNDEQINEIKQEGVCVLSIQVSDNDASETA